jgi:hypothetical protein
MMVDGPLSEAGFTMKFLAIGAVVLGSAFFALTPVSADSPGEYLREKRTKSDVIPVSVTYSIEVVRGGKVTAVPDSYAFHKKEGVMFHVKSNTEGYMYILASGAQGSEYDVLYPPAGDRATPLQRNKDYHLPEKGVELKNGGSLNSVKLVFSKQRIQRDRGIEMSGQKIIDPFDNTLAGSVSNKAPSSFAGESSKTVTLSDPDKALGVQLKLNADDK